MQNKKLTTIALILVVLFFATVLVALNLAFKKAPPTLPPTPSAPIPASFPYPSTKTEGPTEAYNNSANLINEQTQDIAKKQQKIVEFRESLPYTGANFSASYNIDTNQFIVKLDKSNSSKGNAEFDSYLDKFNLKRADLELWLSIQ